MRRFAIASLSIFALACGGDRTSQGADGSPRGDGGEADANGLPFVCNPASDNNPEGLKPITYLDSTDTVYPTANWRVAIEPSTQISWATFSAAQAHESAMLFDLPESAIELGGFLISRSAASASALSELDLAQGAITALVPNVTLNMRLSGSNIQSLDGFDTVVSTTIEVRTTGAMDVTRVRELLMPPLLGRQADAVTFPDVGWASGSDTRFILTMQTLYRADADQTLFMGAIARAYDYEDRHRPTAIHADDLSNGSGLTKSNNGEARECGNQILDKQAKSDIVWVVDESGSMSNVRESIAENAVTFFDKAVALGLDFRMGVTDMDDIKQGVFATRNPRWPPMMETERWIMPNEPAEFDAAVKKPSGPKLDGCSTSSSTCSSDPEGCCTPVDGGTEHGLTQMKNALESHLPRSASDPQKVRPDAKLVVMIVGNEKPQEFIGSDILGSGNSEPDAEEYAAMLAALQPYQQVLEQEDAIVHLIHEPLPFGPTCSGSTSSHGYGYYELASGTGGQVGDVCQENLSGTIDVMLDAIVGDASPIELDYVPISSSITVMRDGVAVPRSRELGWDYRAAANSIIFYGMPIDPAHPADVVIGYRRWQEQVVE